MTHCQKRRLVPALVAKKDYTRLRYLHFPTRARPHLARHRGVDRNHVHRIHHRASERDRVSCVHGSDDEERQIVIVGTHRRSRGDGRVEPASVLRRVSRSE